MSARGFSHPNLGHEARVDLRGKEVTLTFVCGTYLQANQFAEQIVEQLKSGALNLTLMGKPTKVIER